MDTGELGRTGVLIPEIGVGTWNSAELLLRRVAGDVLRTIGLRRD